MRTGQAVFFIPAFTAITSAMLSFLVRPFMVGTEIGGSLAVESLAPFDGVLDAVTEEPCAVATGVLDAAPSAAEEGVDDGEAAPSSGRLSPTGEGRASLLAAQAIEMSIATVSAVDGYLLNSNECIS